jgi:hypothetical protein
MMTDTERIWNKRVIFQSFDLQYVEKGNDYIIFRDIETGKLFELRLKEKAPKAKKKPSVKLK